MLTDAYVMTEDAIFPHGKSPSDISSGVTCPIPHLLERITQTQLICFSAQSTGPNYQFARECHHKITADYVRCTSCM